MGHSSRTLLWDAFVGHSCGALLGYSCETLQVCKTIVSYETSSKIHASVLQNFARDFLKNSRVESAKRAFRTRLPPKVKRQVSKTSVSYETSSKSHASSLQNERFARDFLQKSRVKSPKQTFRTRLPPNVTCQSFQNEHFVREFLQKSSGHPHRSTHTKQPCQAVLPFQFLQTTPFHIRLPATGPKRTLACISRPRRARSPQRVAFRGAPAAPPPAFREKVKKSER